MGGKAHSSFWGCPGNDIFHHIERKQMNDFAKVVRAVTNDSQEKDLAVAAILGEHIQQYSIKKPQRFPASMLSPMPSGMVGWEWNRKETR
jgi:hypothetical protein